LSPGHMIVAYGGTAMAVTFGGLASWRGGWAERSATAVVLLAWFLTPVIQKTFSPGLPLIILDTTQAVALIAISLYSRRIWSLLIAACAGAGVTSDIAGDVAPHTLTLAWAYVVANQFLYGIFVALCLGLAAWECEYLRKQDRRRGALGRVDVNSDRKSLR